MRVMGGGGVRFSHLGNFNCSVLSLVFSGAYTASVRVVSQGFMPSYVLAWGYLSYHETEST